jgi:cytidylate kinase
MALDALYVDSGAVYRGAAWVVLNRCVNPSDAAAVADAVQSAEFDFFVHGGAVRFRVDGVELTTELRGPSVTEAVSPVAAVARVRERVTGWLRSMRELGDLVMEGRDIGTVVFPDARHKFFLAASAAERARRRHAELDASALDRQSVDAVGASLERRDRIDSNRATAPLQAAPDADAIDTTHISAEEVIALILQTIHRDS